MARDGVSDLLDVDLSYASPFSTVGPRPDRRPQSDGPVLALDVPSGVDASSGDSAGALVRAVTTMTLALPKSGLDVGAVGDLWVADIGIPRRVLERAGIPQPPADLFARGYRVRLMPPPGVFS